MQISTGLLARANDRGHTGIDTGRQLRVGAWRVMGEHLVRHLPAVVVHRGLIARAVRHPVPWIGGSVRRTDDRRGYHQADDQKLDHYVNVTVGNTLGWWIVSVGCS